jgi:hypothetical protein
MPATPLERPANSDGAHGAIAPEILALWRPTNFDRLSGCSELPFPKPGKFDKASRALEACTGFGAYLRSPTSAV